MVGYRYFMRNVKLNFLLIFFLIFGLSHQGCADCPPFVKSNTTLEVSADQVGNFFSKLFGGKLNELDFDQKLLQYISVKAIKDQGVGGYFDPKIEVCDHEGNGCQALYTHSKGLEDRPGCNKIYGTQKSGAGVSALVFIDWEGNKSSINAKMGEGLEWEWADGVTDEEKKKFANSPKICACSQKGACMSGISAWGAKAFSGENIFYPGAMDGVCDTCYQKKIKCAPVPLAPGPPPFCEQLGMSPPQVRIVPITNTDNDYFNPKVKVIIGDLKDKNGKIGVGLDFPKEYGKDKAEKFPILGEKSTTHYFKTYKEKDKLCAEYYGTEGTDEKNLQFSRCFPAPPAPEPEIVGIVKGNNGNPSDALEVKIKMSQDTCRDYGTYSGNSCTFYVNTNHSTNIGHLSLKVIKPKIIVKTTDSGDNKSTIGAILEKILNQNKDKDFKILKEFGYVPDILEPKCKLDEKGKCKLDSLGQPEIEVKYEESQKSKMLCLSGWKAEPEEFILEREDEDKVISLKKIGTSYAKYNTVYSKESNQFYDFPCNKTVNLLREKPQSQLDEMIFNKHGYVSIPEENKNRSNCTVNKTNKIDETQNCDECKIVYKLIDTERKKECKQDGKQCNQSNEQCNLCDEGCVRFNNVCERSTQYIKHDNTPFYLRVSQKADGTVERLEVPTKANRAEVFYADKLCRFDLKGLKERLRDIIKRQLEAKRQKLLNESKPSYEPSSPNSYTDNLSEYDYVEIEAWGGGEAGHIRGKAESTEDRQGMPGDYVKAKLKIDPNYPIIRVKVTEGGGRQESHASNKDGGPTIIEMCTNSLGSDCETLITVAGGGQYKQYGREMKKVETKVHKSTLEQGETQDIIIAKIEDTRGKNKQVAYIENSQIKYESIRCDNLDSNNSNSSSKYGAGGCIDKDGIGKNYSKGATGYAIIRPILNAIDNEKINVIDSAIDKIINNPNIIISDDPSAIGLSDDSLVDQLVNDSLIRKLDPKIIDTIKKEIGKELLGQDTPNN